MDKLLLFPGKTEKGIFTFVIDAERNHLEKTASEYNPTIASYIFNAKPIKRKTQILLTALGSGEWWGDNVNGDYFPETALAHHGADYGYETFELYAKAYKHHINKDPTAAYGDVALSVFNPVFHRVELIVMLDNARAPDIVARIEQGDYPDWSMGCKVPFDICNCCGNKAPSRKQYCDCLRYYMGRLHPEHGKKCYAINTMPKFFDISQVLIGADRIAKTLAKVASGKLYFPFGSALLAEKMAATSKAAEIKKIIPTGEPPASADRIDTVKDFVKAIPEVKAMEPPLPKSLLTTLGGHPLSKVLSTMTMMGIMPKPQEFQRMFLISKGQRGMADELDSRNLCFDPMWDTELSDQEPNLPISSSHFDPMLMELLLPFLSQRSYAMPHLGRRLVIMIKEGQEYPLPTFIKIGDEKDRKPIGPIPALLAAAGAYSYLARKAPKEAVTGIDKVLSSNLGVGLAAALGLGLIRLFTETAGPKVRGQFSPGAYENPDANDVFARIEQLKAKPYMKVGMDLRAAGKRLFMGIPAAYMASGVLQKHREINPYDEEGRIKKFVRQNPDVISGALVADALLSAKGSPFSSPNLYTGAKGALKQFGGAAKGALTNFAKAAAAADELYGTDLLKTADAQEFLTNAVVWPLAMSRAGLPGRVVGGLVDQAFIEGASRLSKRKKQKQELK
jgi:hypothetical protein